MVSEAPFLESTHMSHNKHQVLKKSIQSHVLKMAHLRVIIKT